MAGTWTTALLTDCLAPVSVAGKNKIPTRDYKQSGRFPIVDQGQELIAGWTDDENAVISTPLPLIVFGDHTRAFKFMDTPFARGAEGTLLLRPRQNIDPRFFFYACRAIDLPARGYNRHFTVLKEKKIAHPLDTDEQKAIAAILRQVEVASTKQSELLSVLQELKDAAMRELFACGLRGEPQKESEIGRLPETWKVVRLGSLGRVGNGSTPKKDIASYWHGGTYPWLTSAKVYDRDIVVADQFVTERALAECHLPRIAPGAILIAITGQGKTLGHCAVLRTEATINQHIAYVATDTRRANPAFVRGYLETLYDYLRQIASGGGSTKGALTCAFLRDLAVPLPAMEEQCEIATILDALDRKIDLHRTKRAVLDELFKSLLQKLMTGEVHIDGLDLASLQASSQQKEVSA